METTKRIIWSSEIDTKDWEEDIKEWYPDEELTEYEIYEIACENNLTNLEDEIANLDKELGNSIVIVANLGLWNGRRHGYKILRGKTNLKDIFSFCEDRPTWYVEDGEIKCDDIHHDGTNHYIYRVIKNGISEWEFEEEIAEGKDIDELTDKLGHYVGEIYGW